MMDHINAALLRSQQKEVGKLGGNVEIDTTCITKESLRLYAPGAVSFNESPSPPTDGEHQRTSNFTLVMGPSGSGKTMFSLESLPEMIFPGAICKKTSFRIHLKASTLIGDAPNDDDFDLPAGGAPYAKFFDQADKIEALVKALKRGSADGGYAFEKGVHVVVTGTALETSTEGISSGPGAIKIRMKPLSFDNFVSLLRKLERNDEALVKATVERFPILSSLTTNIRCANLLANSIPDLLHVMEKRWVNYVDVSVTNVARRYALSNGLRNLSNLNEKFNVAQEAFRALDDAMDQSIVIFPKFDHIQDDRIRSVTQSLLDIDVEIVNGKPTKPDRGYSVSMTPAITIVLAELLCEKAALSWDWQGLEATVALGEWKRMIRSMKVSEFSGACGIIYAQSPVPHGSAKNRFTLPVVSRSTVLLNGPAAPHACVMAPFRLVQAEFSFHSTQDQNLDFLHELGEMGLTKNGDYRLKQAVTSVLYKMWLQPHISSDDDRIGKVEMLQACSETARCEHYPFQTLLTVFKPSQRTASFIVTSKGRHSYTLSPDDGDLEATALLKQKPINVLEEFTGDLPVTAVFVTNCNSFVLTFIEKPAMTIAREDVDWQGKLKNKMLPPHVASNLRKHVEIRFMFY